MTKFNSTEAPFSVTVNDDADGYTGHHDERPLKVHLDLDPDMVKAVDDVRVHVEGGEAQAEISPAEAYHFADDLTEAADTCWGAVEYAVLAVIDGDEQYVTTLKAPSPESAVSRARNLKRAEAPDGETPAVVAFADEYRVFRADTQTTVRTDTEDDNDN